MTTCPDAAALPYEGVTFGIGLLMKGNSCGAREEATFKMDDIGCGIIARIANLIPTFKPNDLGVALYYRHADNWVELTWREGRWLWTVRDKTRKLKVHGYARAIENAMAMAITAAASVEEPTPVARAAEKSRALAFYDRCRPAISAAFALRLDAPGCTPGPRRRSGRA